MATFSSSSPFRAPVVRESRSGGNSVSGWKLDADSQVFNVSLSPWRDPGVGFFPMAGRPPWVPVVVTSGHHLLRRLQVRALGADERAALLAIARAAPAERLSEQ